MSDFPMPSATGNLWTLVALGRSSAHGTATPEPKSVARPPLIAGEFFSYAWFIYLHGYWSIPINTIFSGMNIHLPAILMFTRGTRFWHTATSSMHGLFTYISLIFSVFFWWQRFPNIAPWSIWVSSFVRWFTYQQWGFSIATLVYQRV